MLEASLEGLSDPLGDDFYEGWIVRKDPFAFISTGELEKIDGKYVNNYSADKDYLAYDFYVLTLEPNDGDPAPADHIVEGAIDISASATMYGEMMKKSEMMDKTMTPVQKALRESIKKKLSSLDMSKIDIEALKERINVYRTNLSNR